MVDRAADATVAKPGSSAPIVVDLDGTLLRTDLLHETANEYLARAPWRVLNVAGWLLKGRAHLKQQLAELSALEPSVLPFNEDVLTWLRDQKAQGRTLVLATASHERLAHQVADHLGLFDRVIATSAGNNLKGARKRDRLVAEYGQGGYEYVGDSMSDVPVWRAAAVAHLVGPPGRPERLIGNNARLGQVWPRLAQHHWRAALRALRPHQWIKNALLFVPLLATHRYTNLADLALVLTALVVFSLTASSVYVLNDLVDVTADRHHHSKRRRPFAAGTLPVIFGWGLWPALLVPALVIAISCLPPAFLLLLAAYFGLTLAYSLRLKQLPVIDVIALASLYTLRIGAGAAVLGVPLSFWMLAFSTFLFLSLALVKRFSELKAARSEGKIAQPLRGRGYQDSDLEVVASMGSAAGYVAVLVLALYIQDAQTAQMYATPQIIWLSCPLLLYWISRCWLIAHRGAMHDDPVVFAAKDRTSWVIVLGFILTFGVARVLDLS